MQTVQGGASGGISPEPTPPADPTFNDAVDISDIEVTKQIVTATQGLYFVTGASGVSGQAAATKMAPVLHPEIQVKGLKILDSSLFTQIRMHYMYDNVTVSYGGTVYALTVYNASLESGTSGSYTWNQYLTLNSNHPNGNYTNVNKFQGAPIIMTVPSGYTAQAIGDHHLVSGTMLIDRIDLLDANGNVVFSEDVSL